MWSFILASFVIVAIPGPGQALITRNSLAGGPPCRDRDDAR
jgi:threonine/homoserine/homoserine lactone efflux protein